jgi:DNA end-binding protein Ku
MPSVVWKGHLTFGLVSIPVKLHRAARKERVRLHYVHQARETGQALDIPALNFADPAELESAAGASRELDDAGPGTSPSPTAPPSVSRVRQTLVTSEDERPVTRGELQRGHEVEPGRYVVFDADELRSLRRRTSPDMEIVRSVRLSEIDPVFLETSYYVVRDRGSERAYAILFAALQATGHVALARVGMYGREHIVIVRPGKSGILAHTMFYMDEIRFENEFRTDIQSVGAKELELAKTFLMALEAPFAPEEFKDVYREELQAMIESKVAHANVPVAAAAARGAAPVLDIFEALKQSIAMKRQPVASETQPLRKKPGRVTDIESKRPPRKAR